MICHGIRRFLCEEIYQFLCVIVSFFLKFLNKPLINTIYGFLEGIDIHIFFICDRHAIL